MSATTLWSFLFALLFLPALILADDRPITIDDLLALESVGNPQVEIPGDTLVEEQFQCVPLGDGCRLRQRQDGRALGSR